MARRVSFRAIAAGQSSFHARPFLRIGTEGRTAAGPKEGPNAVARRSRMAPWQRRVSSAASAVTVPNPSPSGLWPSRPGNEEDKKTVRGTGFPTNGLSPSLPGVSSTARMSGRPSPLLVGQNRISASENTSGRPGLPSGGASRVIFLSSQVRRDPRLRRASIRHWARTNGASMVLEPGPFVVR